MEQSFPFEKFDHKGKEYINMKSDVFYSFFLALAKYGNLEESLIKAIKNRYTYAKRIKRKRIRMKKEKEALSIMYAIMIENFVRR